MNFKAPLLTVVAKADNPSEVDLLLYGVIGDWWDAEDDNPLTDIAFAKTFRNLEKTYDRINVHINSPGGSITAGLAIYNTIRYSLKDVHTYIDGIAASMAAVIALAGKKVHAANNAIFMLHNGSGLAWGNAETMREMANVLDVFDNSIIKSVAAKVGKDEELVKNEWFDYKDHFMSADEAKEAGLVDEVESYSAEDMPKEGVKSAKDILNHFQSKDESMNLKNTWNAIKAFFTGEEVTDEGLEKVNAEVERLRVELTAKETAVTELQAKIDELNAAVEAKEAAIAEANTATGVKDAKINELEAKLAARPGAELPGAAAADTEIENKDKKSSIEQRVERAKAMLEE